MRDFDVIQKLGSGSFGTVFKVRRRADGSVYVIKCVRIAELSYQEQIDAINEVRLLAQMDCPYIVKYFDSFIEEDSLHIVMEFCNKGDLQSVIKKAKEKNETRDPSMSIGLRESVTWNITLQIICGLYYLHKKNVLHRDLKTANVFLTKDEESIKNNGFYNVKIGDLGVAKLLETSTAFAQTIVGTPYYLSPELCSDKPYRDKSDCWALGVLIYECCTLMHPFEARNQYALIMKILQSPVTPPSAHSTSLELSRLIMWLLQKDPSKRPTMREILCESYIRTMLSEHDIPLPDSDLETEPLTNYLSTAPERSQPINGVQTISNNHATTIAPSKTGPGFPPRPKQSNHKQQIRGDRVRGPVHQARVVSDKAKSRYQVKAAPPEKVNRRPNEFTSEISSSSKQHKIHLESLPEGDQQTQLPAQTLRDRYDAVGETAGDLNFASIRATRDEDECDDYYDEDFEDEEPESDLGQGPVNTSNEPITMPDEFAFSSSSAMRDLNEASETCIETEDEITAIRSLVREARQKSLASLGDDLFSKLYDACRSHMASSAEGEEHELDKQNFAFMKNLEAALCGQLRGGIEAACDAVFNMKVLQALEHRLTVLTDSQR